jgi:IMP dehydrogenase/GMP reductase
MTTATNKSGLTDEQINQMAIAKIDEELAKLRTELEKIDAENYTGTSREIKQQMGQNIRARYELEQEKRRLQQLRDHIEGPSEGVKSFLNQEEPVIRTLGTRKSTTVFETAPIDHSGIFPNQVTKVQ